MVSNAAMASARDRHSRCGTTGMPRAASKARLSASLSITVVPVKTGGPDLAAPEIAWRASVRAIYSRCARNWCSAVTASVSVGNTDEPSAAN